MNWKEFVEEVNRQIREQDEDPKNIEIGYIDWPSSYSEDEIEVVTMENGEMNIFS